MNKKILFAGILVIVILVAVIGYFKFTENTVVEEGKTFKVKAFRFGYSPDIIEVSRGDKVIIEIENTDTLHGMRIPDLGLRDDERIEFTANRTGEFQWYCANMCGENHKQMGGKLIIK